MNGRIALRTDSLDISARIDDERHPKEQNSKGEQTDHPRPSSTAQLLVLYHIPIVPTMMAFQGFNNIVFKFRFQPVPDRRGDL